MPLDAHDPCVAPSSYATALHPSSADGYLFQSYDLCNISYAIFVILTQDMRNMFNFQRIYHLGSNLVPSCNGKSRLVIARAVMKASLNFWIALTAALTQSFYGSTNCNLHSFLVRNLLMYFVA